MDDFFNDLLTYDNSMLETAIGGMETMTEGGESAEAYKLVVAVCKDIIARRGGGAAAMDEDKEEAQEEEQEDQEEEDKPDDDMQTEGSQEDAEAAGQEEEGANALAAAAEAEEADDMETEVEVPEWAEAEIKAAIEAKEQGDAESIRTNFTDMLSMDPDILLRGVLQMKGQLPAEQEDDEEEPEEPSDGDKYMKRMVEFGTKVYLKTEAVAEMMNRKLKEADSLVQDAQLPGVCCWSCCSGHLKILVISRWRRARMRSRCSRDKTPSLTCSKALW